MKRPDGQTPNTLTVEYETVVIEGWDLTEGLFGEIGLGFVLSRVKSDIDDFECDP
jgi:hypothetical protein